MGTCTGALNTTVPGTPFCGITTLMLKSSAASSTIADSSTGSEYDSKLTESPRSTGSFAAPSPAPPAAAAPGCAACAPACAAACAASRRASASNRSNTDPSESSGVSVVGSASGAPSGAAGWNGTPDRVLIRAPAARAALGFRAGTGATPGTGARFVGNAAGGSFAGGASGAGSGFAGCCPIANPPIASPLAASSSSAGPPARHHPPATRRKKHTGCREKSLRVIGTILSQARHATPAQRCPGPP